ncbi:MAG: diphthine synthase [Candidatus Altiarchaeota archaeon]
MLNLIGLGLYDEKDLTIRALEALKASDRVYFESYTSFFNGDLKKLSEMCGQEIIPLKRADLEEHPEDNVLKQSPVSSPQSSRQFSVLSLQSSEDRRTETEDSQDRRPKTENVSLLVMGDPLAATTHSDLIIRAEKAGIKVKIIHSSSVYSAVAETGLQLYMFGKTVTIAYPEGKYFPMSPYDGLKDNRQRGLHTLCLLDVKADEGRYMTVNEGIDLLMKMECSKMQNQFRRDTLCVGVARLGGDTVIKYGPASKLSAEDFGGPPHVLIVPGKLHFMEEEMLNRFRV